MIKPNRFVQACATTALLCMASAAVYAEAAESKCVWSLLTGQLDNRSPETGIVTYDLASPQTYNMVHNVSNGNSLGAGVVVDGVFYWFEYLPREYGYDSEALYAYDMEEGTVRIVQSYNGQKMGICFSSPTYDYQTKTVYALAGLMGGSDLVSVDLETGNVAKLMPLTGLFKNTEYDYDDYLKAIAVNYDGDMYGVSYWGYLYKINKVSGECTIVAPLDFNPEQAIMYHTSLAFDNETNELYWRVYTYANLYDQLRKINIYDGTSSQVGIFSDDRLMGDFHIPFTVAPPGAPAKVGGLSVVVDADGMPGCTLRWTNPSKTYGRGGTLESLTKVEIYRNNELVASIDNPGIGKEMSWHDDVPASALYSYRVVPYNEAGKGDTSAVSMFVGQGIPMPVSDLSLTAEGAAARLTWTAPERGKFDAYLDKESLVFEITRSDGVIVAADCREPRFIDNTIDNLARYRYTVKAKNIGGESSEVVSEGVVCGPAVNLPHTFEFSSQEEFDTWERIDGNGDESTWYYNTWPFCGAKSDYNYVYDYPAHDWLISPRVSMEAGKHYKVVFDALPGNKNVTEIVAVSFGADNTPQRQDSVAQFEFRSAKAETLRVSLPVVENDGEYCFGFLHRSVEPDFSLTIGNVRVEEDHDGCVEGVVSCSGVPVADAVVATADGLYSATTDEAGHYALGYLPAGSHVVVVSALGYSDGRNTVVVKELETVASDFTLDALPRYSVSGRVMDAVGDAVTDASVSLGGYNSYSVSTGSDGRFEITDVFAHEGYSLVIERNNLMTHRETIDLHGDRDCGEIVLDDNLKTPYKVVASQGGDAVSVKWMAPLGDPREIRYDDGRFERSLGLEQGTASSVFGHVNRTPSVVYGCWFHIASRVEIPNHYSVSLYIIDLDEEGNPTDKVLYSESYVPVTDDEWTEFELPAPVDCPNGYMMGVAYSGILSLSIDNGENLVPYVNCYCSDYATGKWYYLDDSDFKSNFAFRSVAAPYGGDGKAIWMKSGSKPLSSDSAMSPTVYVFPEDYAVKEPSRPMKVVEDRIRYDVYRGINASDLDAIEWSMLAAGLKDTEYTDKDWLSLPKGVYRYGVKAVYADGEESAINVADSIGRDMETSLRIRVMTDTPGNEANGTSYSLISEDGRFVYEGVFDVSGCVDVKGVWKNRYALTVLKDGFMPIRQDLDLSEENSYSVSLNLMEDRKAPENLQAIVEGKYDSDIMIVWNFPDMISEGFEDHPDFMVNSPGNYGWQYIDGDGAETGAFSGYEWPGIFQPMAYMVFNPYATQPDCSILGVYPYEGNKFLADFAAYGVPNDDWFISPRLFFKEDFRFSFYASSMGWAAQETMQVGYSNTGCEPSDFILLADNQLVDGFWTEYSYDIPATAKYVAIHSISEQCQIFMVDNVRIGLPSLFGNDRYAVRRMPKADGAYEVFLDGEKAGETSETSFLLKNLGIGHHTVGVRSVYTSGYSPLSTIDIDVTTSGVEDIEDSATGFNLDGRMLSVTGEYRAVSLYAVDGKAMLTEGNIGMHDLSGLEDGIYMLVIDTSRGKMSHKLRLR